MSTGIKQKVTQDQWENEREWVVDTLDSTMGVQFRLNNGHPVDVIVEHHKAKRSLEQNDKMQAMIRHINKNQGWGISQTNAKNIITAECFGSKVVNGHEIYCSTSELSTQQMSRLIEWMQRYCDENGIPTLEGHL